MAALALGGCQPRARGDAAAATLQLAIFPALRLIVRVSSRKLFLIAVVVAITPGALVAQGAFGSALAVSGREVYVGQPDNSYGPGVVYVFRADAKGAWRAAKKITRADASSSDGFGSAVAVDGNTLLIGDAKADSESGVVYVFTRDGAAGWRQTR